MMMRALRLRHPTVTGLGWGTSCGGEFAASLPAVASFIPPRHRFGRTAHDGGAPYSSTSISTLYLPQHHPSQEIIHQVNSKRPIAYHQPPSSSLVAHHHPIAARPYATTSAMSSTPLKVGDSIPSGAFRYIPYSPELSSPTACGNPITLKTDEWKGKKIVLFGIPGAFTKSCSANHLPGYVQKAKEIKSKGVSGIYCIASNDAYVMSGWGRTLGSNEHVEMISDISLEWLEAAGLTVDLSANGLGKRAARFALVIDDLKVTYVGIEEQAGNVSVSGADAVIAKL